MNKSLFKLESKVKCFTKLLQIILQVEDIGRDARRSALFEGIMP
jgi:hypothetical protein